MKVAWLLPTLLSGGAVSALGKLEVAVGDKVLSSEDNVLIGKGIIIQGQDANNNQRSRDGSSIQSASANTIPINLDALNIVLPKNQTQPKFHVQQRESPKSDQRGDGQLVTRTNTKTPSSPEGPESQQTEESSDPNPASTSASKAAETRNPASANRAIAGMGAGLVSVMLVFVVFL